MKEKSRIENVMMCKEQITHNQMKICKQALPMEMFAPWPLQVEWSNQILSLQ